MKDDCKLVHKYFPVRSKLKLNYEIIMQFDLSWQSCVSKLDTFYLLDKYCTIPLT